MGRRGERLACRFLKRAGLRILARNYRCPAGEIDLIALDATTRKPLGAETLIFVEVKTRAAAGYAAPEAAVDARKRRQIQRAAEHYLRHHDAADCNVRYDIVGIVLPEGQDPQIDHIADAF